MRPIIFSIFCFVVINLVTANTLKAQQIHQLTQYMTNDFAFNPAVAGSFDQFIIRASYRKQWSGFDGAPSTALLSGHGSVLPSSKAVGLGLLIYSDVTGPTSRTGGQLAYAYQLPLQNGKSHLGFGISGSFIQYKLDFDKLTAHQPGDPGILLKGTESKGGGDVNLGAYFRNEKYWAGISGNQLLASKFNFSSHLDSLRNARHLYLGGGGRFSVSDQFEISPGAMIKMVKSVPAQAEIFVKGIYQRQYWLGAGMRTADGFALMAGIDLDSGFRLAYSYDITTSDLGPFENGSHEITLGYDFNIFGNQNSKGSGIESPR